MNIKQGDILLVPFPFSDQTGKKVRPVITISNDNFNSTSEDIIVCAITTNLTKDYFTVKIEKSFLEDNHIKEECCIKLESILKIDKKLVIKKIDKIKDKEMTGIIKRLNGLF